MQLIIRPWLGLLCVVTATTAIAIMPNKTLPLPNYDRRAEKPDRAPAVAEQAHNAATAKLAANVPRLKVTRDEITGTPKLISSADGFLTGPKAQGRGVSAQALRGLEQDPHRSVKAFLNEHSALFGQDASLLNNARIKREFVTPHNGMRTVIWEQQLDGIPVFEGLLTGHITKNEELVNLSSRFIPNSAQAANAGSGKPAADRAKPRIDAPAAIARAAADVDVTVSTNEIAARYEAEEERPNVVHYAAPGLNGSTEVSLVWLPLDGTKLRLCWQIILTSRTRGEMYRVLVDAEDGTPLLRHCLTSYISEATYRVYTSDSPSPFSPCHPTPLTNQPPLVSRVLVTTMALNTNASPSGWINDGVNETRGNNVDAHLDRDANDSPDLPRPQGSPNRVFDFPMDLAQAPSSYTNASVTQLFYWNNWMHDKLYELGFTEAAGNFQVNNFGRGGVGNDAVNADAQDGAGFNNANFSTPPDGSPGRMQMFLFDAPNPDRDGDFDAEVVLHEYTHGLSNRRVGGGVGISTLQSAGMGEGWSDFYALSLLSESGDDIHATYAAGGYLTFQLAGLLQNYYFGIRRYPYSTDMSKNPLTFKDIDPAQASGHAGVPISPIFGGSPANEVHNQGEVWCVTLWDARANLIEKHGYEIGNHLMLQLVTDGMNLSPANPNFLEARDGIMEADRVLTGGANFNELWRAFAKRGMGFSATSPSSTTTTGVRESFDVPDDLLVLPTGSLLMIGPVGGPFTPAAQIYSLTNVSTNNVIWSAMNSQGWLQLSNTSGSLAPGALGTTVTATLNAAAELLPLGVYTDQITFTNHVSGRTQSRAVTLAVGQPDYFTEQFEGDNDLDFLMLTFTPDGSASHYSLCREIASALPVDPRDGKGLALGDDSFTIIQLAGSARVTLYGKSTNVFFIGSNGYITFDFGDSSLSDSLTAHFALPRISALMTDLNPAAGGAVSWQQSGDRVVVTFLNVPLYGTVNNTNTFQMEMFYDGRIRITYLRVDSTAGLAGLSRGVGLPVAFRESDFSAYPTCSAQFLVSFPSTVTEGQGVVDGTVSLPVAATSNVVATLRSSNPAELTLPATVKISTGETSAPFSATIVDDTRLDGSQRVTITASKSGYTSHNAVTTVHDNEQSELTLTLPAGLVEGASGQGLVAAAQNVDAPVTVLLSVSDSSVQVPVAVTIPTGSNSAAFAIAALNNLQIDGSRLAAVSAHVENWLGATSALQILDDETLQLAVGLPASASEAAGTLLQQALVTLPGILTTNLVVTLTSSDPSLVSVPAMVTIAAGQLSNRFDLTITDNAMATGPQQVMITAQASGWSAGESSLTVVDDEFPPEPFLPSPVHLSSNNPVTVNLSWRAGDGELMANGGFETGDLTGWTRNSPPGSGFIINDGLLDPSGPDGPLPPFAGGFSVLTIQTGPGTHELSQPASLPGGGATLNWAHRVRNHGGTFASNQNFRVEIREGASVLAVPFSTQPGEVLLQEWTEHSFDLTPFGGRTIDVVFVEHDELGFFNAHVDAVSLLAASPQATTYDVYFGTNAPLGPANLLGSTTNSMWDLPDLAPLTTYYWQIVARRLGTTIGPVWQFTTRGVDHFVWEPIASPQEVNVPFATALVASDEFGTPVTNFSGAVFLAAVSQGTTNPVSPSVISNFVNDRWSGTITVADPFANLMLLAKDADGHSGLSTPINVTALNDLSIGAVANPNPVMSQRPLALTLTAHNSGPAAANSVIVSNVLPANFTFISATASQGSCSNATGTVVCNLGSLIGSQTVTVTINVTATGVGLATNRTSITRAEADGVLSNNSAQQVTTVLPFVTLSLTQLSANENAGAFGLICQLSQPSTAPISFDFRAETGTAVAGLDFPATNGTLTIPAGTTSQFLFLGILDDTFDETNETFALALTNVVNAAPQLTRYTLTILDDDAPPSVSIADASVAEGNAGTSEARFRVQLSAMSGANVTVNYNSTAGTAAAGADFIATNGTLNFPPGVTNAEIVISVRGDLLDENNETFNVNLFGPTNVTLFDSLGAGTIIDDDAPPSLRVLDANFVEGQANSTQFVTIELSAASGISVIVGYSTSNGTAIAGSDFTAAAGTLGFSPGTLSRTIPITVLGDTNDEGRERFSLVLSNAVGAVIADGVGLITLLNDDAPAGTVDSFTWNVISNPQYLNASFLVTITARDFFGNPATNFTGPVSITAIAQQPVAIAPATSGTFVEGVWSGNMSVMQPVADVRLLASASVDQTGESNPFDVLATNDISLSMSAAPNPVTVSDTLRFAISVTNTGPDLASGLVLSNTLPAGAQFVSAMTSSGTCSNSANLVVCDLGSLAATQTDITVEIVVSPQAAGLMTNVATVYRAEADAYYPNNTATAVAEALPAPSITISNVVVLEPDTTSTNARFRIFLSHPSSRDVSMEFATVPLNAGPADFVPRSGVLTIIAGTTSAIVDITVLGDVLDETNETFALELSHPTNAVLASATGYADIQDQDPAPLISIDDVALAEGNPPESPAAVLTISLSRPSGLPISLRAATQNSTAVAGLDYAATNTVIYLPPGVTNATFTVSILPDLLDENDENIFVNLSSPTNATLADVRGVATLIDDDSSPAILVSDLSVIEGNSGSTTGIVRVALSHASGRTVSVQFAMQDGTAAGLTDYSPGVGTLVFAPGTTNLSFSIQVFGDLLVEETEDFFVNFFNLTNSTMPDPSIVISIINDDGLPGALDSFSWAAMNSPRRANTPFSATAFARDRFGDIATSFTGTATLRARGAQPEVEIGSGAVAWHYPLASFFHDSRCQVIYLASELQRAQRIAGLALNVIAPPGQSLNNWTIRMKHTTRSNYLGVGFWESGGWTTVSRRPQVIGQTGWVRFPFTNVFDYNGSNHLMIDFSFDNNSYTFDGSCLSTLTTQPRAMTFRSDSANGDPITWSSSPVPIVSSRVPNVRIQPVTTSLPVTPATIGFSSGMWTGNVTVQVPGTNVQLIAEDSFGRVGLSAGFDVLPANTPINLRITRSESLIQLSWNSIAGQSYRVDFTETLDNLSWEPLSGATVAAGPIGTASDALNQSAQRFYRVVELP